MDKLIRKIEIPLAKNAVRKAGLYIAQKKDIPRLAKTAADAYVDYPLHNWFAKGRYDPEVTRLVMKISLSTMFKDSLIYADSEELNGFVVWLPVGFTGTKPLPFILNGGINLVFRSGIGVIGRLSSYETFAMNLKNEITQNRDWYLYNLSVKRDSQGKGIASKLLLPMLNFCNNENRMSFLETNNEKNVGLYEHYGYELRKEAVVPNSTVKHYAMVREPKRKD